MRRGRKRLLQQRRSTLGFTLGLSSAFIVTSVLVVDEPGEGHVRWVTQLDPPTIWWHDSRAVLLDVVMRHLPLTPAWLEEPRRLEREEEQTIFLALNRMLKEDLLRRAERSRSRACSRKRSREFRLRSRLISEGPAAVAQFPGASSISSIRGRPATRDTRRPCRDGFGFIGRQVLLSS